MIEFIKMKDTDFDAVLDFLIQHKLYQKDIEKYFTDLFLVKDQEKICGFGIAEFHDKKCIIDNIYIDPLKRGLNYGDGLLRSMLNFAYINGIKEAYYLGENREMYSFFIKYGFTESINNNIYKDNNLLKHNHHHILFVQIDNFFMKSCKSLF